MKSYIFVCSLIFFQGRGKMKKLVCIILFISLFFGLCSCEKKQDAYGMLWEFVRAYGAEGVIYSPAVPEGDDGYISEGLIEKIYVFSGRFPENYAIFLNSHSDYGSECGAFVCENADMELMVMEMCLERIRLLGRGRDIAFVKRGGGVIFYSTMRDRDRAEKIWRQIIK